MTNNRVIFLGGMTAVKGYNDKLGELGDLLHVEIYESFLGELMDTTVDLLIDRANPNLSKVEHDYFSEMIWGNMFGTEVDFGEIYEAIVKREVPTEYIEKFS